MPRVAAALVALAGCGGSTTVALPGRPTPPPDALAVSLPPVPRESLCTGRLVVEIDRLLVRKYPRPSLTPPFRFLPLVAGVLSTPGGPDEGDVTLVSGKQAYSEGDRVRVFEGRAILDRSIYRLQGLRFEVHLAENHTTITPAWMTYTTLAGEAAQALPGPTAGAIDVGSQIVRTLDKDDIMLTWAAFTDDLVRLAREAGQLHYRLLSPAMTLDGSHAAELDLLVRVRPEPSCE